MPKRRRARNPSTVTVAVTFRHEFASLMDRVVKAKLFRSRAELVREAVRRFVAEEHQRIEEEELKRKLLKEMRRRLKR